MRRLDARNRSTNNRHSAKGTGLLHSKHECATGKNGTLMWYIGTDAPVDKTTIYDPVISDTFKDTLSTFTVFAKVPNKMVSSLITAVIEKVLVCVFYAYLVHQGFVSLS